MSGPMRALEGIVEPPENPRLAELEAEIRKVRRERDDAMREADRAQEDAHRALSNLRKQLTPLYRALQMVFGELDAAGVSEDGGQPNASPAGGGNDPRVRAVWDAWKQRLGGTVANGIDALLLHGELDTAQLAIASGLDKRTVTKTVVYKLHAAGLIAKNNGRFSLKPL